MGVEAVIAKLRGRDGYRFYPTTDAQKRLDKLGYRVFMSLFRVTGFRMRRIKHRVWILKANLRHGQYSIYAIAPNGKRIYWGQFEDDAWAFCDKHCISVSGGSRFTHKVAILGDKGFRLIISDGMSV
jgi:hypothetical protein